MKKILAVLVLSVLSAALLTIPATAQSVYRSGYLTAGGSSCTAATCISAQLPVGASSVAVQITGSFTATVQFEGSVDGQTWAAVSAAPLTDGTSVTAATTAGVWRIQAGSLRWVRVRCSAYTSSPFVIVSSTTGVVSSTGSGGGSGGGTSSTFGAAFPATGTALGITDGTNMRAVKGVNIGSDYFAGVAIVDGAGAQITSFGNGAFVGATGSAVPASGSYLGLNISGTLRGATGVNPSGSIYAAQIDLASIGGTSVGATNGLYVQPGTSSTWAATQSGTWTVQPGNTANSTAWLVTGTGGTFPATQSGTWNSRTQDGSGNAITSTSSALDINVKSGGAAVGTAGSPSADVVTVQGAASGGTALPVSAASLPLPSGAATSALQGGGLPAALGAGGGLKVDGSGTALPVSGTVTAAQSTIGSLKATTTLTASDGTTTALGTAGTAATPVLSVQGIASMTPRLVNPGTADAAEGATPTNPPVPVAGKAVADDRAVDAGDSVFLTTDLNGKLITSPFAPLELYASATSNVTSTTEADIVAADANYRFCITSITVYNSSAADTVLNLYENGSGGTLKGVYPAPAKGGISLSMPTPMCLSAVNKKITIDEAATADAIYVTLTYFKIKR